MLTSGMNTDTVRELASQIDTTARELRAVDTAIERVIADLARQWDGVDYQRFNGWWRDQHRPSLHRVVDSVEGLARSARNNADDQDWVSAASGASGPSWATAGQSRIDYGRVATAFTVVQAALDPGGLGVRRGDLLSIDKTFRDLNDAERRALFAAMSNAELRTLKEEMQESGPKGGFTSAQQAAFLGMLLPALGSGEAAGREDARRLMGPEWALQRHPIADPVSPSQHPADLTAGLLDSLRGEFDGSDYRSRIAPDEIEIRRLYSGTYIVMLPGVQDGSEGLDAASAGAKAAARDGREPIGAGASALYESWEGRNPTDSARDMHYARQSEMQSDNGSANGTNAYAFAVKEAMRVSGVPDGAEVMFVGHSFGAYTAIELATDPGFNEAMDGGQGNYSVNVTHVVAAGASAAFRLGDLPPGTSGVLLNNADDVAYLGERQLPTNNRSSDGEIVFDGSQYADLAGRVNDGVGHQPSNYGAFVRSVNLDQLSTFNESAFSRYGGSGEAFRVTVKDPYR